MDNIIKLTGYYIQQFEKIKLIENIFLQKGFLKNGTTISGYEMVINYTKQKSKTKFDSACIHIEYLKGIN